MFPTEVECSHCFDSGITFVDMQGVDMVMHCDCKNWRDWNLPRWSGERRKPFPAKYFKASSETAMLALAERWKAKIRIAEEFWRNQESRDL